MHFSGHWGHGNEQNTKSLPSWNLHSSGETEDNQEKNTKNNGKKQKWAEGLEVWRGCMQT